MSNLRREGGCMCGAVRYRAELLTVEATACHCEQCRRQSGHFWASIDARGDQFVLTAQDGLRWFRFKTTSRGFCDRCGSFLFWRADGWDDISLALGSLDDAADIVLTKHLYVMERGAYYQLPKEAVQHARGGDEPPVEKPGASKDAS
ncbi:MAG: GFA family protein [Neomegalonema sp.]|nr:GFA family protein [Neomegalonema sp.]